MKYKSIVLFSLFNSANLARCTPCPSSYVNSDSDNCNRVMKLVKKQLSPLSHNQQDFLKYLMNGKGFAPHLENADIHAIHQFLTFDIHNDMSEGISSKYQDFLLDCFNNYLNTNNLADPSWMNAGL